MADRLRRSIATYAYRILDGNDTLNGGAFNDTLTGGFGGDDSFVGGGGDDDFAVATLTNNPLHSFGGGTGIDTITVNLNFLNAGGTSLNLRDSTITSVERLKVGAGLEVSLNRSQLGTGLSLSAEILTFGGSGETNVHFFNDSAGTLDLTGMTLAGNLAVHLYGSSGADTLLGATVKDTFRPGAGTDVSQRQWRQ